MIAASIQRSEITEVQSRKDISEVQEPFVSVGRDGVEAGKYAQRQRMRGELTSAMREVCNFLGQDSGYFGPFIS